MDLPYPSVKDEQLSKHINRLDQVKLSAKLISESKKNIPQQILTDKNKKYILKCIESDHAAKLRQYIENEVINFHSDAGKANNRQNMLHLCAKNNAVLCADYILKSMFKVYPDEYEILLNAKSREGMTACMQAVMIFSHEVLAVFLEYGGVDLYEIDSNKMTAYQLAFNAKNQQAIKMLMSYENKSKKMKIINKSKLNAEFLYIQDQKLNSPPSCCITIFNCLMDCFTCGKFDFQSHKNKKQKRQNQQVKNHGDRIMRKSSKINKIPSILDFNAYFIDTFQIGYSKQQLITMGISEIQWKPASQNLSQNLLFDSFSPLDLYEPNLKIKNLLILFQSLSQHPWILRKIIQTDKNKANHFNINLNLQKQLKIINVDHHIPFVTDTNSSLFIANKKETWPMLLQKALAKAYGDNYQNLCKVPPHILMENLTGWYTTITPLQEIQGSLIKHMQQLNEHGYIYVLEGKKGSYLLDKSGDIHVFTVLSFYTKAQKRLILVNCSFIDEIWLEKEKHQMLALKILKSHYTAQNQMCIWIDEDKILEYFQNIIVSPIKPQYQRNIANIHFKYHMSSNAKSAEIFKKKQQTSHKNNINSNQLITQTIYMKFTIASNNLQETFNKTQNPILMQLVNKDTYETINLNEQRLQKNQRKPRKQQNLQEEQKMAQAMINRKMTFEVEGYRNQYQKISILNESQRIFCMDKLLHIPYALGEYLLQLKITKPASISKGQSTKELKDNNFMIILHSIDGFKVQIVEEAFALVDWISSIKNCFKRSTINQDSTSNKKEIVEGRQNQDQGGKERMIVKVKRVENMTIIMAKVQNANNVCATLSNININLQREQVLEGKFNQNNSIQMMRDESNEQFYFVTLKDVDISAQDVSLSEEVLNSSIIQNNG